MYLNGVRDLLSFYKAENDKIVSTQQLEEGCWISLYAPNEEEISQVCGAVGLDPDFIRAALDEEERARLEIEDNETLIVVDTPVIEQDGSTFVYSTIPLGIIMTKSHLVTVCLKDLPLLRAFSDGQVKGFSPKKKNRFILQILYRNSALFLSYLKRIDKASTGVENELHKSMKNKELIQMLGLEKSLVYFSTSLKSNEMVLEKMTRTTFIRNYPEDLDLLEDVIIENKQAIEMCAIYRDILSGTMDAFASVISNNLNIVMKVLTSITIVLTVPSLVAGLWGMNVVVPFENSPFGFWIVLAIATVCAVVSMAFLFIKKLL